MADSISLKVLKWIWLLLGCVIGTIQPHDLTVTRMGITQLRIRAYWKTHGKLPTALSDLPLLNGRDNETTDGWGRPIKYDAVAQAIVTLSSLRADARSDDEGPSEDIKVTFDAAEES